MKTLSFDQLRRTGTLVLGGFVCVAGLSTLAGCGGASSGSQSAPTPVPVPPAPVPAPVQTAPLIANQPANQSVPAGQDATFSVSVTGTGPFTYQWSRNGVAIPGATAASYTLISPKLDDSADVLRVAVRNGAGAVDSAPALLLVEGSGVRTLAGPSGKIQYKLPQFNAATGIAPHPAGGIYQAGERQLYRIGADGKVTTLVADAGCELRGGAVDKDGVFYAACGGAIARFGPDGARLASTVAVPGLSGTLALAIDSQGVIHIADREKNTLWRIEAGGAVVRVAGTGTASSFSELGAIAVDPRGGVVVVDKHALRRVSAAGVVSTLAGAVDEPGFRDGGGAAARFYLPDGLAIDAAGTVYVSDTENRVIRKISASGEVTTLAGGGGEYRYDDGSGRLAGFFLPRAMLLDAQGNLLVSDTDTLRKVTPGGTVTTVAGTLPSDRALGWTDGAGREARFQMASAMVRDGAGNLFIADTRNHAIRKVSPTGIVTTLVGGPHKFPSADGSLATAAIRYPGDIALGPNGTLYVTDGSYPNMPGSLRRIGADGVVSTIALAPDADDPRAPDGAALPLHFMAVAADSAGNVFVAAWVSQGLGQCSDSGNCKSRTTVRRIAPDGKVTLLLASENQQVPVLGVSDMVTDKAGNLFVLSGERIIKIAVSGAISVLLDEDKTQLRYPHGLTIDAADNLIFATSFPSFIDDAIALPLPYAPASSWRFGSVGKVTPQGVLSVLATPYHSDPALSSMAWNADGNAIAVDAAGALYLSSYGSVIKVIVP